jgi:hypothetical protein
MAVGCQVSPLLERASGAQAPARPWFALSTSAKVEDGRTRLEKIKEKNRSCHATWLA